MCISDVYQIYSVIFEPYGISFQEKLGSFRNYAMNTEDASEDKKIFRPLSRLKQERELRAWTQSDIAERIGTTQVNVSRWEKGITIPGPYYRQKLRDLFGKSMDELGLIPPKNEEVFASSLLTISPSTSYTPIWNVPYRRNPFFTGRENILSNLYAMLQNSQSAALTQAQAISGLGGIGKTQIAIEYAYRYLDEYQAILWVTASSREAFTADFVKLAALLDLPEQYEQDQEFMVSAVKRWLSTHKRWLLILDNVDNLEMLADFLPVHSSGDVLLTTRLQALGTLAQSIEVEKMGLDEGIIFLLRRTKLLPAGTELNQSTHENQEQAVEIVTALDGLPLALDQAGAYIEETRCSLSHYLDLYSSHRKDLLRRRGRFPVNHPDSVAITWSISFQKVEHESLAAVDLLHLLAFLDPEAIPEEIIIKGASELGTELELVENDPLKVDIIIELLLRYSLIRRNSEAKLLKIHRLVQAVLKDGMDKETQRLWAERAIRAVNRTFPDVELKTWEECQRCLPHVLMCATFIEEYDLAFPEAARLCNEAATYLIIHAQYEQAEFLLHQALSIRKQVLYADHPDTARTLNDLGVLYLTQSKFQQAEPLLHQALSIRQTKSGVEHSDTATSLNNRAQLYYEQGHYSSAERMYQEALEIRQRVLQHGHPDIAQSLNNLAELYTVLGKFSQAESLYEEALSSQKNTLGSEHPLVAQTLDNMALLYRSKGEYAQAEQYYQQALDIQEQVLGFDHPDVAETLNNLARLYRAMGAYGKAEPLYQSALHIRETTFGTDHPQVAQSYYSIAKLYHSQGKYFEAEKLFKQTLVIQEQKLGTSHPTIASTLGMLAKTYQGQNKLKEAEKMILRALRIRESTSGADHPHVAILNNSLVEIYHIQGRYDEAVPLIAKSLTIQEQALGPEHPYIAYSLSNQAENYSVQGEYTQAMFYYEKALDIRERHLGVEDPRTAQTYYKLAQLYNAQSRYEKAESLYLKAITIRERTLGTFHPTIPKVLEEYAMLLHKMHKSEQAYELEERASNIWLRLKH
jgi:tetratricopeptide (TPR) repeat protein/transcriptional regulator with XRE-family HTH domain